MRVVDVIYVCSSKVLNTVVFKFSCGLDDGQMAGYGQAQSAGGVHPILPG